MRTMHMLLAGLGVALVVLPVSPVAALCLVVLGLWLG